MKPFHGFQDEIPYHNGILLKGDRIIVPSTLRTDMLKIKQRARSSLHWPGMDNQIEHLDSNCSTCLNHRNKQRRVSMIPHPIPDAPWVKVATDLFTLNNRDYIIPVDYYSRFIEIFRLSNMKSSSVIAALKHIFSIHGIPKLLFNDNGPQYVSREFRNFSISWDFEHHTSSPEFPQSNGLVEREIQTVKRVIRKAEESNEDHYLGLLNFNAIPVKDGLSPAEKMFNIRIRTVLPSMIF